MRDGFTLVWVGWQWDTPEVSGRMRMFPPIATENGATIRGVVRSDFVPQKRESDHSLADRNHIAYPVADTDAAENVLTVRDDVEAERRIIPRSQWKFARVEDGKAVPDPRRVYLEGGFEPFKIYEVVYVSENPPLVGLGPGAIRDVVSHLKYDGAPELDIPVDALDRALGFGTSQSGRFLRTYLYHGFNEDESHRRVFDGVIAHVAGGGRGSFNHRFAQASRDAHPYINFFHLTNIFPFTDRAQVDFRTGVNDGLLRLSEDGAPAKNLLHELFIRVLGSGRVSHSYQHRRSRRRQPHGQRAYLPLFGHPTRTRRVSADRDIGPTKEQPHGFAVVDARPAGRDGSMGRGNDGPSAESLRTDRERHAG